MELGMVGIYVDRFPKLLAEQFRPDTAIVIDGNDELTKLILLIAAERRKTFGVDYAVVSCDINVLFKFPSPLKLRLLVLFPGLLPFLSFFVLDKHFFQL